MAHDKHVLSCLTLLTQAHWHWVSSYILYSIAKSDGYPCMFLSFYTGLLFKALRTDNSQSEMC